MARYGRKRKASAQDPLSYLANAALPSKKLRRMLSGHELKTPTGSQSYVRFSDPQTMVKKFGKQLSTAGNKSKSSTTPGSSSHGESPFNESLPSSFRYDRVSKSGGSSHSLRKTARSQNIIDDEEEDDDFLAPDSGVNGPSLDADSDENNVRSRDDYHQFLWTGISRGTGCNSSAAHWDMLRATKPYLLAIIFGGAAGGGNIAWLEPRKIWLSNTMKQAWKTMATHMGRTGGKKIHDVAAEPTPAEARILYDTVNDWRSHAIQTARHIVGSSYPWSDCKTAEEVKQLCKALLKNDCFTCLDRTAKPPAGRFGADIISTALRLTFWNPANMGIAMQSYTEQLFEPLPDTAVAFVCTCIEHAIREYESGGFTMIRFRGQGLNDVETRFRKAFNNQVDARKNALRNLMLHRVRKKIDVERTHQKIDLYGFPAAGDVDAVADPSEAFDHLSLFELPGEEEHRGVSLNKCKSRDLRSSKSYQLNDVLKDPDPVEDENMGEDAEDESTSLNKNEDTGRVRTYGRPDDSSVKAPYNMETNDNGKKASESETVSEEWTGGDLYAFLSTPKGRSPGSTSGRDPAAPTHAISDEEEYDKFLLWVKGQKRKT